MGGDLGDAVLPSLRVSEDFGNTWQVRRTGDRNWNGVACSADCNVILASASGGHPLVLSPLTTFTGSGFGLAGEPGSSVDLQYLGAGVWTITSSSGGVASW